MKKSEESNEWFFGYMHFFGWSVNNEAVSRVEGKKQNKKTHQDNWKNIFLQTVKMMTSCTGQ